MALILYDSCCLLLCATTSLHAWTVRIANHINTVGKPSDKIRLSNTIMALHLLVSCIFSCSMFWHSAVWLVGTDVSEQYTVLFFRMQDYRQSFLLLA